MEINREILRGYDIRGVSDKDLSPEIAKHIGLAYGTYMIKNKEVSEVVVGYDMRSTSEAYKNALIEGLTATGLQVIDIGLTLTGTIYWAQYHFQTKAAIMVTASHNPAEYNGFKLQIDYSESMVVKELNILIDIIEKEGYLIAEQKGGIKHQDIKPAYYQDLLSRFKITKLFKVVIDASCATAGVIVPELLRQAGCEVIEKNTELDSSFPLGVADPTEEIVAKRLAQEVLETSADIGFSYDADGDRIGIVDEKGTIIWNDTLVALFAIDVLSKNPGEKIMFNTLCSKVVSETIEKHGGIPYMYRTGHGFLKKKNQEVKAPFIGELSGHFFFSADFYNHDDGCYATLRLLDFLNRTNQSLHQAISALPAYISSPEIKIYCADDKKVGLMDKISEVLRQDFSHDAEIIDDERAGDGVRLDMPEAMFVIRYSQNGPYITIKFEAKAKEKYNELKQYISKLLHAYPEIDWENSIKVNIEALQ